MVGDGMKKHYRVYDGRSSEARLLWLTDAEAAEYRRNGYYVTEV